MNPPSRKNVESADAQAERERQAFEKRAAIYNKHAKQQYHHHRVSTDPVDSISSVSIACLQRRMTLLSHAA